MFDFISFGLKDLIDIAAVVFLVFQFYRLIRGTVAVNIFIGILLCSSCGRWSRRSR